jgi:hypothetical protein
MKIQLPNKTSLFILLIVCTAITATASKRIQSPGTFKMGEGPMSESILKARQS